MENVIGGIGVATLMTGCVIYAVRTGLYWVPPPRGFKRPSSIEIALVVLGSAMMIVSFLSP
jgi:hypothetical protein